MTRLPKVVTRLRGKDSREAQPVTEVSRFMIPEEMYQRYYLRFFTEDTASNRRFAKRSEERREDIEDTYRIAQPAVANFLEEQGIDNPALAERIAVWGSFMMRHGLEDGITQRAQADARTEWTYDETKDPIYLGYGG